MIMAECAAAGRRASPRLLLAGLVVLLGLSGCQRQAAGPDAPAEEQAEASPAKAEAPAAAVDIDPRLTQSFTDATRPDTPADWPRPPDVTAAGKSVGKLYTEVVRLWKEIPFVTPEGKHVEYSAVVETDLGTIEIALRPDVAPNHVRNFVALARAGYYDGLVFERIIHEESEVEKGVQLDLIEGGGPLGVANPLYDSIGYWLKPEFSDKVRHEEGTVGACRGEEEATAACKFYIIVGKVPPALDGHYTIFGKVTRGLDVARTIHRRPVVEDEEEVGYRRPKDPVVIRKVTIHTREVDRPATTGDNK